MNATTFFVAGTSFRQEDVRRFTGGEEITFIPEPDNPYDPHAVKVMGHLNSLEQSSVESIQLGYVPRQITLQLKRSILTPSFKGAKIFKVARSKPTVPVGVEVQLFFEGICPNLSYSKCKDLRDMPDESEPG